MLQSSSAVPAAEVLHQDADLLVGGYDEFLFLVWKGETTRSGVERAGERVRRFAVGREGLGLLTVVEEQAPLPSTDARRALAELLRSGTGVMEVSAVVFEGAGFRAAAVRAVVTGLTMLARQPFPHRVFESPEEATKWLTVTGPKRWIGKHRALLAALADLRASAPTG